MIFSPNKCLPITHAYDLWSYPPLEEVCFASNHISIHYTDLLVPDTLWASGYEIYDRISEPMRKFLEPLTANYTAPCKSDRSEAFELPTR